MTVPGSPGRPGPARGSYRARIVRVGTGGLEGKVWVEVPRYNPGRAYGPCDVMERPPGVVALAIGDRVAVQFLEGRPDELLVLGRIYPDPDPALVPVLTPEDLADEVALRIEGDLDEAIARAAADAAEAGTRAAADAAEAAARVAGDAAGLPYHIEASAFVLPLTGSSASSTDAAAVPPHSTRHNTAGLVNDVLLYDLLMAAGTWRVDVYYLTGPNHGIVTPKFRTVDLATFEGYTAAPGVGVAGYPGLAVPTGGRQRLELQVRAKNVLSGGFRMEPRTITATRTGA